MLKLTLPLPPSVNHSARSARVVPLVVPRIINGSEQVLLPPDGPCTTRLSRSQIMSDQPIHAPLVQQPLPTVPGTYRITDAATGRFYIGSSLNIAKRWSRHLFDFKRGRHHNPVMRAIWNIDPSRLSVDVIEVMPGAGRDALLAAEQRLLDAANVGSNRDCMNMLPTAGSHAGRKRSHETCLKLKEINRGRSPSPESRAKMRAAKLGRKLSEEHRRKIGMASRGKPGPVHTKEALASFRKYSDDQVASLRAAAAVGESVITAARRIGISASTAYRIIRGDSYQGVGDVPAGGDSAHRGREDSE